VDKKYVFVVSGCELVGAIMAMKMYFDLWEMAKEKGWV
jgi:hypothetical protein